MTFEQILDGGYVVAADDWLNMVIVWNGSGTFNVYAHVEGDAYRSTDCFTRAVANAYEASLLLVSGSQTHTILWNVITDRRRHNGSR